MTSQSRRRRKKAEKKQQLSSWHAPRYEPIPMLPPRAEDSHVVVEIGDAIERHLDLRGVELERLVGGESIVFGRKKAPLVYVFASEAAIVHGGRRITADFRGSGEHWAELRALLLEVQGSHSGILATDMPCLLTSFSPSLQTELSSAALQASARIRADLRIYPCPVVLESGTYRVRF